MHSVCCEKRAETLIVMGCSRGYGKDAEYYANELAAEQTLENLDLFGAKLRKLDGMIKPCPCGGAPRSEE